MERREVGHLCRDLRCFVGGFEMKVGACDVAHQKAYAGFEGSMGVVVD